jgi:hypothetical protein
MFKLQDAEHVASTLRRTTIPLVYAVSARVPEREHEYAVDPLLERQKIGAPDWAVAMVSATAEFKLGVQSTRFAPELLTHVCTRPVPEMKFSVGWVPWVVPLVAMFNPDMPAPLQLVRPFPGSSVQPPPVKFKAASTGRLAPAF